MSLERDKEIDRLFQAALDLPQPARNSFLTGACADDPSLLSDVHALLTSSESTDDDVWSSARDRLVADVFAPATVQENLSGKTIGHWDVRKQIARGGLATVYLADRSDETFEQRAALKVLRRGLDTDDVVSRFHAERQILSTLNHSAIARILDGGALDDGRPFLVMEYVDGASITDYSVQNRLDVRGKVELIIEVLRALHHAHTHLVIHRDVKPSNILVSTDGKVSLLDFGIAKILDASVVPGASTATRTGVSLLTPGYGSPEQLAGAPVTTASDIYQVGIVLYELLTQERAFSDGSENRATTKLVASRVLKGKPGFRAVHGDLDAIVGKATHGDPDQRYASADEMRLDLQRYLSGLPVLAQPDSYSYRLTKLAKRRPWLFPMVALVVLAITGYITTITSYSQRLAAEEQLAVASQKFLIDLFRSPDPFNPADSSIGSDITVLQALEIGRHRLDRELTDQPRLKASLLGSIADVYSNIDRQQDAIVLWEEALSLEKSLYGVESRQVAASLQKLVPLYRNAGQTVRAGDLAEQQLVLARKLYAADSAEVGIAMITAGVDAHNGGEVMLGRQSLADGIDVLRPHRESFAVEMINALILYAQNLGFDSAEHAFDAIREAEEIAADSFGAGSLQHAGTQIRFASSLTLIKEFEESERIFRETLPVLESSLGRDHSSTISALGNFAFMMTQRGDDSNAEALYKDLLDRQINLFGADSRAVADTSQNLGAMFSSQGRFEEAVPSLERAHRIYATILNDDNYVIAFPLLTLAYAKLQMSNSNGAYAAAVEALQRLEKTLPDTYLVGVARCLVGVSMERRGQRHEGSKLVTASHLLMDKGNIPEHYQVLCRYTP